MRSSETSVSSSENRYSVFPCMRLRIRPSLTHKLLSLIYCCSHRQTAALYGTSTDTWNENTEVTKERNLMTEGANHETKGSEIKFSECIRLSAPGINLDADTSSSTTSHPEWRKITSTWSTGGWYTPPLPHQDSHNRHSSAVRHVIWQS
jgi:hypothetical protein